MQNEANFEPEVSVLTAGRDRHYSLGLAAALIRANVKFDFIGSDELECKELQLSAWMNFCNLRGDQSTGASLPGKAWRVIIYYFRLIIYALRTRSKIFHILWNNKFEWFDRTLLMGLYKLRGKKIAFTAHNVNAGVRDGYDSWFNRLSLKFQYRLCDRIFAHTTRMKGELIADFGVPEYKIVLIPYGWNNMVPDTDLTGLEARQRLKLEPENKVILFFGNIAPYKGLEFLIEAFETVANEDPSVRLVIAGRPRGPKAYWKQMRAIIAGSRHSDRIIQKIGYVTDDDTEFYFKAADVLILPYVQIFQSGVLFLSYSYGLPVIATDVGSLKEEIFEGRTGRVCEPKNAGALARSIKDYFQSDLYWELEMRRHQIRRYARRKYSWNKVAAITAAAYAELLSNEGPLNSLLKKKKNDEAFSFNSHSSLQR